jgi:hypothetical protein
MEYSTLKCGKSKWLFSIAFAAITISKVAAFKNVHLKSIATRAFSRPGDNMLAINRVSRDRVISLPAYTNEIAQLFSVASMKIAQSFQIKSE